MAKKRRSPFEVARARKINEAIGILRALGFGPKQSNEVAAYTLLALLDLTAVKTWVEASNPLRGITPIIAFIKDAYRIHYAPNTRETIRDEAVKYFADAGMLIRNPDNPARPTNSGKTVYQVEPHALELFRSFGSTEWTNRLETYLEGRAAIRSELERNRDLARIPVTLPSGGVVTLSAGGQNPLIKTVIEELCPRFAPGGVVVYIGDAEDKFLHLDADYLEELFSSRTGISEDAGRGDTRRATELASAHRGRGERGPRRRKTPKGVEGSLRRVQRGSCLCDRFRES